MNRYRITYNLKSQTNERKAKSQTTFGMTKEVEAPSSNWAQADFLGEKLKPWELRRTITKIEVMS
jgi:hypothetical protein